MNIPKSLAEAKQLDAADPLRKFRGEFVFPESRHGHEPLYFAGHSLGLMPKNAPAYVQEEMQSWGKYGVEGHFEGKNPWLPYHENITASFARLVGAKETETVAMNTLTVNLAMTLKPAFTGVKNIYMYGTNGGVNSSWQQRGTWTVPGGAPPVVTVVTADWVTPNAIANALATAWALAAGGCWL